MRQKRPSIALHPEISARAVVLRGQGLSYRAVVAQLTAEGKKASLDAVWRACNPEGPPAPVATAAPPGGPPAALPVDLEDLDDVDAQERADELRAIAGEAGLQVSAAVKKFRAEVEANGISIDAAGKLLAIAERAEKLARLVEKAPALPRAPASGASVILNQTIHTSAESSALAAARAARGGGDGA